MSLAACSRFTFVSRWSAGAGRLFSICLLVAGATGVGFESLRPTPRPLWSLSDTRTIWCALMLIGVAALARHVASHRTGPMGPTVRPPRVKGEARITVAWPVASLVLLLTGGGCTSVVALAPRPGDPDDTVWLQGVRFDPSFVRDTSLKLGESDVYWVLPGEQAFVKWQDYHVHAPVDGSPWDCNFCAELRSRSQGGDVCRLPDGKRPAFAFSAAQVQVQESPLPAGLANSNPQAAGPFQWDDGCFTPAPAADQPDFGPMGAVSIAVNRSASWTARADIGDAIFPSRSPDSATFWVIPPPMPPRETLAPYVDPSTQRADLHHWIWTVQVTTDANGKPWWSENFAPGLAVGKVRVLRGTSPVVPPPHRVRVYERIDTNLRDPFGSDIFYCLSDPTAVDGDIDLTRCRGFGGQITPRRITPAYDRDRDPPADQLVRTPLTWVVEFSDTSPAPTLNPGESLAIEFTLLDAASVR